MAKEGVIPNPHPGWSLSPLSFSYHYFLRLVVGVRLASTCPSVPDLPTTRTDDPREGGGRGLARLDLKSTSLCLSSSTTVGSTSGPGEDSSASMSPPRRDRSPSAVLYPGAARRRLHTDSPLQPGGQL